MLKRRIIPKILVQDRQMNGATALVSIVTQRFSKIRIVGDPISQAKLFESQLADELIVLIRDGMESVDAEHFRILLCRLAQESFMPLAVGGGVDSIDKAGALISSGADKVVIGAAALKSGGLLQSIASQFGAQSLIVSLDVVDQGSDDYIVMTGPGRTDPVGKLRDILHQCESSGAGEILVTDITRDGQGDGLNIDLGAYATGLVKVPVILSGGAGTPSHFGDAFTRASVDAVAASTFFSRRDQTPMEVRAHMKNLGIPTRAIS